LYSRHTSGVVTDSTCQSDPIQNDAINLAGSLGDDPVEAASFQPMLDHHQHFGEPPMNPQWCNPRNEDIKDEPYSPPGVEK